ncbi:type II toxin-antitoxin system RelE/ParE family toxin [Kovacikia minuta CCNUW1]|uniref:type II toxin-antitoxin system RelE/ParE family toxin n=1 Tax=Kovacikia minuta TaxID=2931930 RepID=UPI001CCA5942|nr:type II toxin-antitoxin system RelE/ParE family toxin [Kovacikia minuta]UBF27029.1 type II toxin-antitoxin system RelE/ParE family toxin [Kovacikia minuta CCNUW1]
MTGSTPFSIEESDNFKRSFKKLAKVHKGSFIELIAKTLEDLIDDQYPNNSRNEPLPGKIHLPEGWTFHKLELWVAKGASGQIRLMYLINSTTYTIRLVWIYSHEQFAKRPTDADLKSVIKEILDF